MVLQLIMVHILKATSEDPEYHQSSLTPFSAVLAPDTSNTTMLEIYKATVLREMGIRLTNELYDGIRIPNQHDQQE